MSAIVLSNFGAVTIQQDAGTDARKQAAISKARETVAISDPVSEQAVVESLRDINTLLKLAETSRTEVKAPVIALGKKIDEVAKTFCLELDIEKERLSSILSRHQAEQRRIAQEAERNRLAELERIENERRAAAKAEQDRLAAIEAEEQAKIDAQTRLAKTDDDAIAALGLAIAAEAFRQESLKLEREEAERLERLKPVVVAAPIVAPKPSGVTTREVWKFEVQSLELLAQNRPKLVRIEANASAINAALASGERTIPGLRIWPETQSTVRSA